MHSASVMVFEIASASKRRYLSCSQTESRLPSLPANHSGWTNARLGWRRWNALHCYQHRPIGGCGRNNTNKTSHRRNNTTARTHDYRNGSCGIESDTAKMVEGRCGPVRAPGDPRRAREGRRDACGDVDTTHEVISIVSDDRECAGGVHRYAKRLQKRRDEAVCLPRDTRGAREGGGCARGHFEAAQ